MATLTASAAQSTSQAKYIEQGAIARSAIYTFTAAQSAGDVIQMVKVPSGAQIHDVSVVFVPGAGGPVLTWSVGDGNAAQRYQTSVSAAAAVVQRATAGLGYSYSAEDTIDITVGAVASATAAGSIRLTVIYSMDQVTDGTGS